MFERRVRTRIDSDEYILELEFEDESTGDLRKGK